MSEFRKNLSNLVNAGFTYIYIPSYEERRVINEINNTLYKDNSVKIGRKLFVWTQTNGLMNITPGDKDNNKKDTRDAVKALEEICSDNDPALYIFNDIHVFFRDQRDAVFFRRRQGNASRLFAYQKAQGYYLSFAEQAQNDRVPFTKACDPLRYGKRDHGT